MYAARSLWCAIGVGRHVFSLLFALTFVDEISARMLRVDKSDPEAFATITGACAAASDGDTIRIARGTYVGGQGEEAAIVPLNGVSALIEGEPEVPSDVTLEGIRVTVLTGSNVIIRSMTWRRSGNTAILVAESAATVIGCVFDDIYGGTGACLYGATAAMVVVSDCRFLGCSALTTGGAISGSTFSIDRCEFIGNSAGESGGAIHGVGRISHCLFVGNRAPSGAAVALSTDGITGGSTVEHCTFVDNEASGGGAVEFLESRNALRYSIITGTKGGVGVVCWDVRDFACCNLWGNEYGNVVPLCLDMVNSGSFSEDPQFCDPATGDWRLKETSPCASGTAGGRECGLIGALGVGCSVSPVERASWGKIKRRYAR